MTRENVSFFLYCVVQHQDRQAGTLFLHEPMVDALQRLAIFSLQNAQNGQTDFGLLLVKILLVSAEILV